jgi:transcription elongation GreA/GreB family factor
MNKSESKQKITEACKNNLNDRMAVAQEDLRRLREGAGRNADDNMSETYESNQQEMLNDMSDLQAHFDFLEESAALFNRIDFQSAYDQVQPGAVVVTDKMTMLVGISGEFESEGKKIHGISTSAPIYEAMKNKKAGDSFSVNSTTFQIKDVY